MGLMPGWRERYWKKQAEERRSKSGLAVFNVDVPPAVIEDRNNRERGRQAQSITAQFFGDPPPGYSAFDRLGNE